MKTIHLICIVPSLLAIAGCNPVPRYTLHEGTDPRYAGKVTLRMDAMTGKVCELGSVKTNDLNILMWRPIEERDAAFKTISVVNRSIKEADQSLANTNTPFTY
jgi:hypothetical protein